MSVSKLIIEFLNQKDDKVVITDNNGCYTTLEFKKKVFFFKNILSRNIKINDGLGILLDRNVDYLAIIFASMLCKNYYVPLSTKSNSKLIKYQIKTSQIKLLASYSKKKEKTIVFRKIKNNANIQIKKKKLAYIIFTSGSTGPKKGVCISNKAFYSYILSIKTYFKNKFKSKSLLINGELTFDISNADFAFALIYKCEICITNDSQNIFSFFYLLENRKIESIYAVPSAWKQILSTGNLFKKNKFKFIKQINSGGELLTFNLFKNLKKFAPKAKIYNFYGPTEFTINSHCGEINNSKDFLKGSATIGKCLPGTNFYLINKRKEKNLVLGELALSGNQIMSGYINSKDEPFKLINKKKYYMTGDEFIYKSKKFYFNSRLKDYIKVSGFRVNLQDLSQKISNNLKIDIFIKIINNELILFSENISKKKLILNYINNHFEWYEKPKKMKFLKNYKYLENGKVDVKSLI